MQAIRQHFELIRFLIERDCKIKYRRTVIGAMWALLAPMLHYLIIGLVVSQFVPGSKQDYAIMFLAGALPFALVSICCQRAPFILLENQALMRKAPLPKQIFIFQTVAFEWLQSLGVFLILTIAGSFFQWLTPSFTWLWILPVYALGGILLMGAASLLSTITVLVRDTGYLMPVVMQTFFFLSPVAYSLDQAPANLRWLLQLNPISLFIESLRQPLLAHTMPWGHFTGLSLWAMAFYILGQWALKVFDREILLRV